MSHFIHISFLNPTTISDTQLTMSRRGNGDKFYSAVDQEESSDEANLVSDSELTSGRTKKYVVVPDSRRKKKWYQCSRNEWICIVLGAVVVGVILVVLIGVGAGVGAGIGVMKGESSSSSGGDPWKNVRLPSSITPEGQSFFPQFPFLSPPHPPSHSPSPSHPPTHTHTQLGYPLSIEYPHFKRALF